MKKLALVFLLFPFSVNAQFNKGQMFLGGTVTAQGNSENNDNGATSNNPGLTGKSRTLAITPKVGYFLNDKWGIGASLGYSFMHSDWHYVYPGFNYGSSNDMNSFSAGLFARRYFAISEKFLFAMEGNLRFSRSKYHTKSSTFDQATGTLSWDSNNTPQYDLFIGMRPVFLFFPSPRWGVEAGLGILSFDHQQNLSNRNSANTFAFTLTSSLSIGLSYYFKRK